jgi:hypothetical protein
MDMQPILVGRFQRPKAAQNEVRIYRVASTAHKDVEQLGFGRRQADGFIINQCLPPRKIDSQPLINAR